MKQEQPIEQEPSNFILEEELLKLELRPNSHLDIISTFIREKNLRVENSKQLSNLIKRYCRVASEMSEAYSNDRIYAAVQRIKDDNASRERRGQDIIDWTLETVYKYLMK